MSSLFFSLHSLPLRIRESGSCPILLDMGLYCVFMCVFPLFLPKPLVNSAWELSFVFLTCLSLLLSVRINKHSQIDKINKDCGTSLSQAFPLCFIVESCPVLVWGNVASTYERDADISAVPYERDVRCHPQPVLRVSLVSLIIVHLRAMSSQITSPLNGPVIFLKR